MNKSKIGLIFIFAIILLGCGKNKCELKNYKTFKVKKINMFDILKVTGVVEPQVGGEIKVGSRISGTVEKLFVSVGDYVKKGDLIAIIEHSDLQARVNELKYEKDLILHNINTIRKEYPIKIKSQKDFIESLKADLKFLKKNLQRYRELYKNKMISKQELEKKEKDFKSLKKKIDSEQEKLILLKTEMKNKLKNYRIKIKTINEKIKIAEINLGYAFIKAPISGVVSTVSTQEGETVAASLNAPVFVNIVNLKRLQVIAYIDEVDIGKIKKDEKVKFYVEGFPNKIFLGKIKKVYPKAFVKDNVVTFKVEISIDKGDYSILRPKMTAYIDITISEKKDTLAVPMNFVKIIKGRNYVFIKKGKSVKKIPVETGIVYNSMIEILKGLKENQEIILPDRNYLQNCLKM